MQIIKGFATQFPGTPGTTDQFRHAFLSGCRVTKFVQGHGPERRRRRDGPTRHHGTTHGGGGGPWKEQPGNAKHDYCMDYLCLL